jgi:hypothetical protein
VGLVLHGKRNHLRPVREADIDALHDAHVEIANRGSYFPRGVRSESAFRRDFAAHGMWQKEEGLLVVIAPEGELVVHIEYFRPFSPDATCPQPPEPIRQRTPCQTTNPSFDLARGAAPGRQKRWPHPYADWRT